MLKKIILLVCLFAPIALVAQDKIAYVNTNEIMATMPEVTDIQSKRETKAKALESRLEAVNNEYKTKAEALQEMLKKLNEKDPSVTETAFLDAQKELTQLQERAEVTYQNAQAELQKYEQELWAPLAEKIQKAIKEVGDEQNFLYIIDVAAVHYVNPAAIDASKFIKTKLGIVG